MEEKEEEDKNGKTDGDKIVYKQCSMEKYGLINDCFGLNADNENQKFISKIFL